MSSKREPDYESDTEMKRSLLFLILSGHFGVDGQDNLLSEFREKGKSISPTF